MMKYIEKFSLSKNSWPVDGSRDNVGGEGRKVQTISMTEKPYRN